MNRTKEREQGYIRESEESGGEIRAVKGSELKNYFIDRTCDYCRAYLNDIESESLYLLTRTTLCGMLQNDYHIGGIYGKETPDKRLPIYRPHSKTYMERKIKNVEEAVRLLREFIEIFENEPDMKDNIRIAENMIKQLYI